jgi:hypothetical protein
MSCAEITRSGNPHPKTATEKHLDIECGDGFNYDGDLPDPMLVP